MIKKAVFIICLLITMAFNGPVFGSTYYGYDDYGGSWHDANKTGIGDNNLCWAAAASNILDWAGYDNATYTKETEIFSNFRDHWTDKGGLPKYGWEWYLNGGIGNIPSGTDWSHVYLAGSGGNNWPSVLFASVYDEQVFDIRDHDATIMVAVDNFLHAGYGVTLNIYTTNGAHTLTCWGFDYNASGYQGVWVTDSDDGIFNKVLYSVSQRDDNAWYLDYGNGNWYIGSVEALARNATRVPEPATLLLLVFGLLGLAGLRKKNN